MATIDSKKIIDDIIAGKYADDQPTRIVEYTNAQFFKVFEQAGTFAATNAAEKWLSEHGYSVGTNQRGSPRGIMRGDCDISKWRNLSSREIAALDGTLTGDGRNGPVTVMLKHPPEAA